MSMTPQVETDVIGRHGTVYSHDAIGSPANAPRERIEMKQRESALAMVRESVEEDIEKVGIIELSDMRRTCGRTIELHESISRFVPSVTLEQVTAEYLGKLTKEIIDSDELSDVDYEEYLTGLAEFIPELTRSA